VDDGAVLALVLASPFLVAGLLVALQRARARLDRWRIDRVLRAHHRRTDARVQALRGPR
jgi:hypothetical protein